MNELTDEEKEKEALELYWIRSVSERIQDRRLTSIYGLAKRTIKSVIAGPDQILIFTDENYWLRIAIWNPAYEDYPELEWDATYDPVVYGLDHFITAGLASLEEGKRIDKFNDRVKTRQLEANERAAYERLKEKFEGKK